MIEIKKQLLLIELFFNPEFTLFNRNNILILSDEDHTLVFFQ